MSLSIIMMLLFVATIPARKNIAENNFAEHFLMPLKRQSNMQVAVAKRIK